MIDFVFKISIIKFIYIIIRYYYSENFTAYCRRCKFYFSGTGGGQCRRHAPQIKFDGIYQIEVFPIVNTYRHEIYECGDYKRKKYKSLISIIVKEVEYLKEEKKKAKKND